MFTRKKLLKNRSVKRRVVDPFAPDNPREIKVKEYFNISKSESYDPERGVLSVLGWEYDFSTYLKKYIVRNGVCTNVYYSNSPSDLKQVLRAQGHKIHKNFWATQKKGENNGQE